MASVASSGQLLQGLCHTGRGGTTKQDVGVPGVFYNQLFLNMRFFCFFFFFSPTTSLFMLPWPKALQCVQ